MAAVCQCRAAALTFACILLALVLEAEGQFFRRLHSLQVSLSGTVDIFLPSGTTCSTTVSCDLKSSSCKTREDFLKKVTARLKPIYVNGIKDVKFKAVRCDASPQRLGISYQTVLAKGVGPSGKDIVKLLRGLRDDAEQREILFKDLKGLGFKAERMEIATGMWECTDAMDCSSLTGFMSSSTVRMTLGVNSTTLPPEPVVYVPPPVLCPFHMLWFLPALAETIPCGGQAGLTFGGFAALLICCPLCCYISYRQKKMLIKNLCGFMDPEHMGTGNEAFKLYWWTPAATTAEECAWIDSLIEPPAEHTKPTSQQLHALIEKWHMDKAEGTETEGEDKALKEGEIEGETEGEAIEKKESENEENDPLHRLLAVLVEKGYLSKDDPENPTLPEAVAVEAPVHIRAGSLLARAVGQKGCQPWSDAEHSSLGTPAYKDGTVLEFYSIRNVCWLVATVRVFAHPLGQKTFDSEDKHKMGQNKIVYGVELQLEKSHHMDSKESNAAENPDGDTRGANQWRYAIGFEQLRLKLEQGELAEVGSLDGTWIPAIVEGPRLEFRQDVANGQKRQQLGYNLKAVSDGRMLRMIPAERVRRAYGAAMDVFFYESPLKGWVPYIVKTDSDPNDSSNHERAKQLQPWISLAGRGATNASNKSNPQRLQSADLAPAQSEIIMGTKSTMQSMKSNIQAYRTGQRNSVTNTVEEHLAKSEESRVDIWMYHQIGQADDAVHSIGRAEPSFLLRPGPLKRRLSWL